MTADTKALRELIEKIEKDTPLPWRCVEIEDSQYIIAANGEKIAEAWATYCASAWGIYFDDDALILIVEAINAIPEMLDVYDNLEKLIGGLREFAAKLSGLSPEQRRFAFEVSLPLLLKALEPKQ